MRINDMRNTRLLILMLGFFAIASNLATKSVAQSSSKVDTFSIEIVNAQPIDSDRVFFLQDHSLLNPAIELDLKEEEFESEPIDEKTKNGRTKRGGSGRTVSGGGGFSGVTKKLKANPPNFQLEIKLTPNSSSKSAARKAAEKLVMVYGEYQLVDDLGNKESAKNANGWFEAPGFETTDNEDSKFAYVCLPSDKAKTISSLRGQLVISDGYKFEAYVTADEMNKKTVKKIGKQFIEFSPLEEDDGEYSMTVTFSKPKKKEMKMGPGADIQKLIQEQIRDATNHNATVLIKGSDGVIYRWTNQTSAGGGNSGGGGFSSGGGSSFSFNGSGNGNSNQRPTRRNSPDRRKNSAQEKAPTASVNFGFNQIPDGVKPVAIKCIVVQRIGDIDVQVFELSDIPIISN